MKLLPSKHKVLPKKYKVWDLFAKETELIAHASCLLLEAVEHGSSQLESAAKDIQAIRRKSDEIWKEIQHHLCETFITPIDPEDISTLGEELDRVCDHLEEVAYRIAAYGVAALPHQIASLSEKTKQAAELLQRAFLLFSTRMAVDEPCTRILEIRHETRDLVRGGVKILFAHERDPISVIKTREIYDVFEDLGRSFQRLASSLPNLAFKNT